ncbi:hydrogenase maturation nickel metallochaperone HypA [Bacillus sp. ISL-47]|uniref:hydrogenase maturation nickel metallochaperone HypA/HybF n=1 Tax=Bacillus sp. ISL-47 TaxID=2819130 RepID=UPI001BEC769C|nr:hydrogenase maturation nickel metallochaperone HypA [Bacillus sp. ISL-47]MBT2689535.1 hydrogenase maturation nickel metallochaperone HypA [Bacillus sp. ISL-47]MBT2708354.1 hydrogenase maturation nickel metallochaperone HypA [Pseudomonas sp. ISL-84]
MHELSLMGELLHIVEEDARQRGFIKINSISVIVGDLSNVLPDALELAFSFFQTQSDCIIDEETQLLVIREEAKAACLACGTDFVPDYRIALCSQCNQTKTVLLSGETFRIESYEGSDKNED